MSKPGFVLSREQVRRIDRLAMEQYGLPGCVLMENAGRSAAEIVDRHYGPHGTTPPQPHGSAIIFCGTGNNGGDGFVMARHLRNAGWTVQTLLAGRPERLTSDAALNHRIVEAMHTIRRCDRLEDIRPALEDVHPGDIVIDALLGTGFQGEVRSPLRELIDAINARPKRALVAVDVPSGLDCDTGVPAEATIRADLTISFVAAKRCFLAESARPFLGKVVVAGIGIPQELIEIVRFGEED